MEDVIIIGGGPAGLTAALYGLRSNLNVTLLEKSSPGGQLLKTNRIENYPGFPEGIDGYDLAMNFYNNVKDHENFTFKTEEAKEITKENGYFTVKTNSGEIMSKSIVLAMGGSPRFLNVPGEREFAGKGVSYCAVCDGNFFKNKITAVVGGGDTAFEDALYLANLAEKVYIIHRSEKFRASAQLVEQVKATKNIILLTNTLVSKIEGDEKVTGLVVTQNGVDKKAPLDGVFVAIGQEFNVDIVKNLVNLSESNQIITNDKMQSSQEGIFACGDIVDKPLRQVSTAVGDGALAGQYLLGYLTSNAWNNNSNNLPTDSKKSKNKKDSPRSEKNRSKLPLPVKIFFFMIIILLLFLGSIIYIYDPFNMLDGGNKNSNNSATTTANASPTADIYATSAPSVVQIQVNLSATSLSLGSGVVFDAENGYIVTNYHVVTKEENVKVSLLDQKGAKTEVQGTVVATDPASDIAIIQVKDDGERSKLTQIKLGDSSTVRTGETALVIGTPISGDFFNTLTTGVISSTNRTVSVDIDNTNSTIQVIQTDAAINPGNSGGALINDRGELIGIVSSKSVDDGSIEGIGFAIPINNVKKIIDTFSSTGKIQKVSLGVSNISLFNEGDITGVKIGKVASDSSASTAGLKDGDIITKVDGKAITSIDDFNNAILNKEVGQSVELTVNSGGNESTITATL